MIRTILKPDRATISFDVPEKYIGKKIEVIAFEMEEGSDETVPVKKEVSFDAVSIDTRGFHFDRDEANA